MPAPERLPCRTPRPWSRPVGRRPDAARQYTELAELAGGFIHDIKNHLGTLSLNLQLLAEDFENPQTPRERKALDRVTRLHGECQKLVDLANDFLRFARVQNPDRRPTPLDEVVGRMIDFLAPTARQRNIEINWFPAPDLPPVRPRPRPVRAGAAEPDAQRRAGHARRRHAHPHRARRGRVGVPGRDRHRVRDAADVLAKVFRPFHTTKKDGNGLGLATAAEGGRWPTAARSTCRASPAAAPSSPSACRPASGDRGTRAGQPHCFGERGA